MRTRLGGHTWGTPSLENIKLEKKDTVAAAEGTNIEGIKVRIQVTATQARGSINTAARICRLCFTRLLQGDTKEATLTYRQQLLDQLPENIEGREEVNIREMINLRRSSATSGISQQQRPNEKKHSSIRNSERKNQEADNDTDNTEKENKNLC